MSARLFNFANPDFARDFAAAPLLVAVCAGAAALFAPPLAMLLLAVLGARAIMRSAAPRIDLVAIAGPAFAALLVGAFVGLAGGIGVLFVWRLIADTRWSVREATRLALAAGRPAEASWKALAHAWTTPLYGLTLVAYTAPHMVAGLPLDLPHLPFWAPLAAGVIAAGAFFDWALRRAADWRLGELAAAPAMHLIAHHLIFLAAFGLMFDVSAGIFALAAWRLMHAAPARHESARHENSRQEGLRQASLTAVP